MPRYAGTRAASSSRRWRYASGRSALAGIRAGLVITATRVGDAAVSVLGEGRKAGRQEAEAEKRGEHVSEGAFHDPSPLVFKGSGWKMGVLQCERSFACASQPCIHRRIAYCRGANLRVGAARWQTLDMYSTHDDT